MVAESPCARENDGSGSLLSGETPPFPEETPPRCFHAPGWRCQRCDDKRYGTPNPGYDNRDPQDFAEEDANPLHTEYNDSVAA